MTKTEYDPNCLRGARVDVYPERSAFLNDSSRLMSEFYRSALADIPWNDSDRWNPNLFSMDKVRKSDNLVREVDHRQGLVLPALTIARIDQDPGENPIILGAQWSAFVVSGRNWLIRKWKQGNNDFDNLRLGAPRINPAYWDTPLQGVLSIATLQSRGVGTGRNRKLPVSTVIDRGVPETMAWAEEAGLEHDKYLQTFKHPQMVAASDLVLKRLNRLDHMEATLANLVMPTPAEENVYGLTQYSPPTGLGMDSHGI